MVRVSIIIPTYNRARFVGAAVESALGQEVEDLEVVVVDDGSTDDTRAVIARFTDPRLRYVYQDNQGATRAFNRGIQESTGDYISVLGSDDAFLPNALPILATALDRDASLGSVSGGFHYVNEDGAFLRESCPWEAFPRLDTETWLMWCPSILQASLIRRCWFDRIGLFDPAVSVTQDWDFGLRLAYAGCKMAWIPSFVFKYRLHRKQISRRSVEISQDYWRVLDKFYAQPNLPGRLLAIRDRVYAHALVKSAIRLFESGEVGAGARDLEQAIRHDPSLVERDGQRIFDLIVGWAVDAQTVDSVEYVNRVFANLPSNAGSLARRGRQALAAVEMGRFFQAHASGNRAAVRCSFVRAVRLDPSWLRNRGVISILLQAIIGKEAMTVLRRVSARAPRKDPSHRVWTDQICV